MPVGGRTKARSRPCCQCTINMFRLVLKSLRCCGLLYGMLKASNASRTEACYTVSELGSPCCHRHFVKLLLQRYHPHRPTQREGIASIIQCHANTKNSKTTAFCRQDARIAKL